MSNETMQTAARIKDIPDKDLADEIAKKVHQVAKKNAYLIKGAALESNDTTSIIHLEIHVNFKGKSAIASVKGCLEPLKFD